MPNFKLDPEINAAFAQVEPMTALREASPRSQAAFDGVLSRGFSDLAALTNGQPAATQYASTTLSRQHSMAELGGASQSINVGNIVDKVSVRPGAVRAAQPTGPKLIH